MNDECYVFSSTSIYLTVVNLPRKEPFYGRSDVKGLGDCLLVLTGSAHRQCLLQAARSTMKNRFV